MSVVEHVILSSKEHAVSWRPSRYPHFFPAEWCPVCRAEKAEQRIAELERERDVAREDLKTAWHHLDRVWDVVRGGIYGPPSHYHLDQLVSIRALTDVARAARVTGESEK